MKNLVILTTLLMSGMCVANGSTQAARPGHRINKEHALKRLEREWLDAGQNKDAAAIQRILADDFTITFGDGSTRDKAEVLRRLRLNGTKNPNTSEWTEDSKVRIYGNAAIITGRYMYRIRYQDKETISESRYTDTYIKQNGRWQVVASHLSKIATK